MIKVLQVTPRMDYGGVASVVRNFYSVLNHEEIRFDFVDHGQVENYHQELIDGGSIFYYFETIGKLGIKKYKEQIKDNIDLSKYDIVHIHLGDLTGIYANIYRKCGAKHIINHAHGSKPISNSRKYFEWLLRLLAVKEADICIACGNEAGKFIFGEDNYYLIPNGIDINKFNIIDEKKTSEMKKEYCLVGKRIITNIGNYFSVKNQKFLLDIVFKVKQKYPDIVLILAGEGPDRNEIEEKVASLNIQNQVILAGTVTDISTLLHISDVFLLPSLHEGLPMAGIEAQATGIPCIFSNNIDHEVNIGNKYTFFLPINKGVDLWADKIISIIENHYWDKSNCIYERLKKRGYDINENAKTLQNIYRRLANQ